LFKYRLSTQRYGEVCCLFAWRLEEFFTQSSVYVRRDDALKGIFPDSPSLGRARTKGSGRPCAGGSAASTAAAAAVVVEVTAAAGTAAVSAGGGTDAWAWKHEELPLEWRSGLPEPRPAVP